MKSGLAETISENAGTAIVMGVVMLILGLIALTAPAIAGMSITVVVGLLVVAGGIAQCVLAFKSDAFGRGILVLIMGLLTILVGIYMSAQPLAALVSITFFLAIYFLVAGVVEIVAAIRMKPAQGWGWMLFNAVVTLVLGAMIWGQFPLSGIWAVGVLFGVKLACGGATLISLGSAARRGIREATAAG
jgi:uncharacterized membrane protein HdeD (DUF308 family)